VKSGILTCICSSSPLVTPPYQRLGSQEDSTSRQRPIGCSNGSFYYKTMLMLITKSPYQPYILVVLS